MVHDAIELLERHVALAIAVLPVVAHLATGVANKCAVVDEHGGADRVKRAGDDAVDQVARHACGCLGEIAQPEAFSGHLLVNFGSSQLSAVSFQPSGDVWLRSPPASAVGL